MKKIFVVLSLCACSALLASDKDYNWEFTPTIGGVTPLGGGLKKVGYKTGLSYGGKIAKNLQDSWFDQVEFGFDYAKLKASNKANDLFPTEVGSKSVATNFSKGKLYSYQFNLIKDLSDFSDTTKFYGLVGLGYMKFDGKLSETDDKGVHTAKLHGSSPFAQVGVGLKQYLSDNFALRFEVRDAYTFKKLPSKFTVEDEAMKKEEKEESTTKVEDHVKLKRDNLLFYSLGFSLDFGKRVADAMPVSNNVGDSDNDGVADNIDRCPNTPADVVVDNFGCEKIVRINLGVNFKVDSAKVKEKDIPQVKEVADFMNQNKGYKAIIAGYTDSTGSAKYNQKLSERRANSFANILKQEGVDPTRITTIGYGEENPIATNKTKAGRAQNRRVEAKFRKH